MSMQSLNDFPFTKHDRFKITYYTMPKERTLPHSSGYHYHNRSELLIVKNGLCSVSVGENIQLIEGSYVVYIPKNTPHCTVALANHEYSRYCLFYDESCLPSDVKVSTESFVLPLTKQELQLLEGPAELLYKYFYDYPNEYSPIMVLRRDCLLKLLINEIATIKKEQKKRDRGVHNSYITKICEYLTLHYNEKISLTQLSNDFFVSKAKLTKDFKNKYGVTICDFIATLRLRTAKKQLMTTQNPIWKIAEECGYKTSVYFIQQFSKAVGVTPLQYRKNSKIN